MKARSALLAAGLFLATGCGGLVSNPVRPDPVSLEAVGSGESLTAAAKPTPPNLVADVTLHSGLPYQSQRLVSTCPGQVTSTYTVRFGHTQCLAVQPTGSSYALTDDISLNTTLKQGAITHITLRGQDKIGDDGIMHETDAIPLATRVVPDPAGFTLHVHADQVPVWRLSGHLNGSRVAIIGTISIWDIVYRAP